MKFLLLNKISSFVCIMLLMLAGCQTGEYELEKDKPYDAKGTTFYNVTTERENLLVNGGLEKWEIFPISYDIPSGWGIFNNANVKKNTKVVYEGYYSAKMESRESGKTAKVEQAVKVTPGHKIRIRFRYRFEKWKANGARTYCYFRTDATEDSNISADVLREFYGKDGYYIVRGGGYGKTYLSHDLDKWQTFDETILVPPTTEYFVFEVNSNYGTTIYVDDCWVMDVT